ncbi:uncharacterized protein LOC132303863 [Cornus florida]|uniref:uncharacterized protein LOC132303863 n=1 Tax=Cornus florida TaxID=4283 RepID=UPI0028A1BA1F|nr:uncharacterized protein LOC132303863 [Cornus florida]
METGVDLLVENLMKLLNTDDELVVKAYGENRIQKEQIQWFYQEMQFMRMFLKDSEDRWKEEREKELKDVVARIIDVTGEVDVIVDSFILSPHFRKHMDLALQHHRREPRRSIRKEIRYRVKLFLSSVEKILKSYMPIKNHPNCSTSSLEHGVLSEYFKSVTENIVCLANKISDLLKTLEEDLLSFYGNCLEISGIFSGIECGPPVNKCLFFRRKFMKEIVSIKTKKFYLSFHSQSHPLQELSQRLSQVLMMGSRLACPAFCKPNDCLFLSNMLKQMAYEAGRQLGSVCVAIKDIKSIKTMAKTMAKKGLSATWFDPRSTVELGPLLDLSVRMVEQAEKIRRGYGGVLAEIKCIKREVMKINDSGMSISGIYGSFAPDKVSYVIEEIKSIKTHLVEIYENKMYGTGVLQIGESSERASTRAPRSIVDEEIVVGFDDEKTTVEKLLVEEHERQLKVISIIGMPGLGKTTLAKIIYNGDYIVVHGPTCHKLIKREIF